ncbi:MAG: hypothetical protein PF638_08680 [Candidatus Delongbacteria bacterium]|jgi:uncharacterized protein YsxB (DUF464 family)|nr:hypothetical protein [Candidatus Delongbacteria bacterium]
MEEKKVQKKVKKKVDIVAALSIILVTAIICIFNSWLYYDAKIERIQKNNEVKAMYLQSTVEDLNKKNKDLQLALDKFNSDIEDALEKNK